MGNTIRAQKWYKFESASIHAVPEDGGIYVIRRRWYDRGQQEHRERNVVIKAASNLRQALLDALPPLGPNLQISRHLVAWVKAGQLSFSYRVVTNEKEREETANSLIAAFEPDSNQW